MLNKLVKKRDKRSERQEAANCRRKKRVKSYYSSSLIPPGAPSSAITETFETTPVASKSLELHSSPPEQPDSSPSDIETASSD